MCVEAAIVLFTAATSPWVDRRTNSEYDKLPPKACTVVVADLNETAHQLDVTAKTLYEAVAQALATVRGHDWVGDSRRGLTDGRREGPESRGHAYRQIQDFENWLNRGCKSPAETVLKARLRQMLGMGKQ